MYYYRCGRVSWTARPVSSRQLCQHTGILPMSLWSWLQADAYSTRLCRSVRLFVCCPYYQQTKCEYWFCEFSELNQWNLVTCMWCSYKRMSWEPCDKCLHGSYINRFCNSMGGATGACFCSWPPSYSPFRKNFDGDKVLSGNHTHAKVWVIKRHFCKTTQIASLWLFVFPNIKKQANLRLSLHVQKLKVFQL